MGCLSNRACCLNERGFVSPDGFAREVFISVAFVLKGGIPWRLLPQNFPPWKTVYDVFREAGSRWIMSLSTPANDDGLRQPRRGYEFRTRAGSLHGPAR